MASQISQNIRRARENARLDQAEVAKRLGIHPMTLSRYERGVVAKIPGEVLHSLATLYGLTISDLVDGKFPAVSDSVPRGTMAVTEPPFAYGAAKPKPAGIPAEVARKIELFKREMAKADASEAELDYIDETFRRPETARLAHHDSDGKALSPAQVEEQYDALIEGVRQIITRRIDRRRKAAKAK